MIFLSPSRMVSSRKTFKIRPASLLLLSSNHDILKASIQTLSIRFGFSTEISSPQSGKSLHSTTGISPLAFSRKLAAGPFPGSRRSGSVSCPHNILIKSLEATSVVHSSRISRVVKAEHNGFENMELDTSLSPMVNSVKPSKTVAIIDQAIALAQAGVPVTRLAAGEADFDTPSVIAEAGINAIREGYTRYTPNAGTLELRQAICHKLQEENGISYLYP